MREALLFSFIAIFFRGSYCYSDYLISWYKLERFTHKSVIEFISDKNSSLHSIIDQINLNSNCRNSLIDYINGISNFNLKDIKRFDSTGKWPTGLLSGTFTDLGSYDTCISLQSTQYCLLYTNVPLMPEHGYEGFMRPYDPKLFNFSTEPFKFFQKYIHFLRQMNITTGLCVPKECSRFELKELVNELYQHFNTGLIADVDLCYSKPEQIPWRVSEIIGLIVIFSIISANLIGLKASKDSVFYCFNPKVNLQKLLKISKSNENMNFIDGFKVITMICVILSHIQMGNLYSTFTRLFNFVEVAKAPVIPHFIFVSPYNVDIFLMITGLLMGYLFFTKKQKFHLVPFIIVRWLRFATLLAWVICIRFVFFGEHFRSVIGGPFWNDYSGVGSIVQACERTWPLVLVLSNIWFETSEDVNVCQLFDWYLVADFIFGLLFLTVLWPFLKNHKIFALINTFVYISIGFVVTGLTLYRLNIPTTWITTNWQRTLFLRYNFDFNLKPWPHMGPYFIGVLFGYIISNPKLKLSKNELCFGWFLCLSFLLIVFGYEISVNRFGIDFDYPITLSYGIVVKTIWAASWAWIILILKLGHFPFVSQILSCKFFRILSKISLSVLCAHGIVIRLRTATTRVLIFPTYTEAFLFNYLPMYIIIYALSFITAIFIEFPTVNLLKKVFLPKNSNKNLTQCNNNVSSPDLPRNININLQNMSDTV